MGKFLIMYFCKQSCWNYTSSGNYWSKSILLLQNRSTFLVNTTGSDLWHLQKDINRTIRVLRHHPMNISIYEKCWIQIHLKHTYNRRLGHKAKGEQRPKRAVGLCSVWSDKHFINTYCIEVHWRILLEINVATGQSLVISVLFQKTMCCSTQKTVTSNYELRSWYSPPATVNKKTLMMIYFYWLQ